MSETVEEPAVTFPADGLDELPEFGLSYSFDDLRHPERVTVMDDDPERLSTHWLSVDKGYALDLEEVR